MVGITSSFSGASPDIVASYLHTRPSDTLQTTHEDMVTPASPTTSEAYMGSSPSTSDTLLGITVDYTSLDIYFYVVTGY